MTSSNKATKESASKTQMGEIQIHTENIFPIIKKWLYSDHEIFLRELLSNAHDAIIKRQKIARQEGKEFPAGEINIQINETDKTLTISDNGLGMNAEEIQKYIAQIAFSGAEDFVKKFKDKKEDSGAIIGHFGLGFYSAFMVADTVEIDSLSMEKNAKAAHWRCDGSTQYELSAGKKNQIGTDIVLHITQENKPFLKEGTIKELVKKYANFFPVDIKINGQKGNDTAPLWLKSPEEVKEEEYKEFYKKLFPFNPDPIFWIHLSVDYPIRLQGILYFPKLIHELDSAKSQVKLYCHQVFVTDQTKDIIPEFLTLLQGAIDCPDLPLNVSRSQLQNNPDVKKISNFIVKKVADKLKELYTKDKANYEKQWEDISPFIKFGMMNHDDFYKRAKEYVLFKSSNGYATTLPEYQERNTEKLQEKVLYATNKDTQAAYINACKSQGLEVLFLQHIIDSHFIQFLESKDEKLKFTAVDSDLSDLLADKSEKAEIVDKDNKTDKDKIVTLFQGVLKKDQLTIKAESLKSTDISAMITESEMSKRLKAMSAMMKGNMPSMPEDHTLVLNTNNEVIKRILSLDKLGQSDKLNTLCNHVYDLARMAHQPLSGEELQAFLKRSNQLLL